MADNNLKTARPPSGRVKCLADNDLKTVWPPSGRESVVNGNALEEGEYDYRPRATSLDHASIRVV